MKNHQVRQWGAIAVTIGLASLLGAALAERPEIQPVYDYKLRAGQFVRQPDTMCAVASDTLRGPSVDCFGAMAVVWRIRANSGTCSTLTAQVSKNDTNWIDANSVKATKFLVSRTEFAVGDSLNQGGTLLKVIAWDSTLASQVAIPYAFNRVILRRRVGMTAGGGMSGPTPACRTRCDSIRWSARVQWSAP